MQYCVVVNRNTQSIPQSFALPCATNPRCYIKTLDVTKYRLRPRKGVLAWLISKKWLHGIEVYNYTESYPDVIDWCLEYNLAMTGNTDIHGPVGTEETGRGQSHLPMTLVFAKSRTESGVKEALFAGKTLVWFGDTLAGRKELAKEFFLSSIEIGKVYYQNDKTLYRNITNKTDIPYFLTIIPAGSDNAPVQINVPANSSARLRLPIGSNDKLLVTVENIIVSKGENLKLEIRATD